MIFCTTNIICILIITAIIIIPFAFYSRLIVLRVNYSANKLMLFQFWHLRARLIYSQTVIFIQGSSKDLGKLGTEE